MRKTVVACLSKLCAKVAAITELRPVNSNTLRLMHNNANRSLRSDANSKIEIFACKIHIIGL